MVVPCPPSSWLLEHFCVTEDLIDLRGFHAHHLSMAGFVPSVRSFGEKTFFMQSWIVIDLHRVVHSLLHRYLVHKSLSFLLFCVEHSNFVLDFLYHDLIVLGFCLLNRKNWVGCELFDLMLAHFKLFKLTDFQPVFGFLGVLEVKTTHVLRHGGDGLTEIFSCLLIVLKRDLSRPNRPLAWFGVGCKSHGVVSIWYQSVAVLRLLSRLPK